MNGDMTEFNIGVVCGHCQSSVYMETCRMSNDTDHDWVVASECQSCGLRNVIQSGCPECQPKDR